MPKCDFGGYVTKNDVECSDGRRIKRNAFVDQDGTKVPLVWMHQRNDPNNVLGHAILENRPDGVYGYCTFNDSEYGRQAKLLVEHGDVNSLSIYANKLVQKGKDVTHGMIREVSLVIAGANPGALIDNPIVQHADSDEDYEDLAQAIIYSGSFLSFDDIEHADKDDDDEEDEKPKKDVKMETKKKKSAEDDEDDDDESNPKDPDDSDDEEEDEMDPKKEQKKSMQHADEDDDDEETVQDVYDSMTDKQKKVVAYMIGAALSEQEEDEDDEGAEHSDMKGDNKMKRNIFDQDQEIEMSDTTPSLSHDDIQAIFDDAKKCGSLKESFLEHATSYGIENIDILFPDAKAVANEPYMLKRDTEWVAGVLSETRHVPFSRIKSVCADLTADEARARGYVKGALKKEEVIKLLKRMTTPTTVYKKQKLDRDDILDITDLNIVAWLKAEMRIMLNEELARAFLVGDGREADDPDKINEDNIRPIWKDEDMYAHHVVIDGDKTMEETVEEIIRSRKEYKGSGSPTFYTTADTLVDMLLMKDKIGRRLYNSEAEVASNLRVSKIVEAPVMEEQTREVNGKTYALIGIIVNLRDYTVGATAGGQVSMFDDFDIDYNQQKYLIETRCCGALVMPKSAIVIERDISTVSRARDNDDMDVG